MLTVYRPGAKVGWRLARCRSVWFPGSPINVLVRLQGFQRPEQLCLLPSSWVPTRFFHDPPTPIVSGGVGHVDVPHTMLTRDRTQIRAARTVLTAASCRVRTGDVVHSGSRRLGTVPRHLQRVGKDLSNVRAHVCTQHHRQTVTKATGGCSVCLCPRLNLRAGQFVNTAAGWPQRFAVVVRRSCICAHLARIKLERRRRTPSRRIDRVLTRRLVIVSARLRSLRTHGIRQGHWRRVATARAACGSWF